MCNYSVSQIFLQKYFLAVANPADRPYTTILSYQLNWMYTEIPLQRFSNPALWSTIVVSMEYLLKYMVIHHCYVLLFYCPGWKFDQHRSG
jgi:hypothetical protein